MKIKWILITIFRQDKSHGTHWSCISFWGCHLPTLFLSLSLSQLESASLSSMEETAWKTLLRKKCPQTRKWCVVRHDWVILDKEIQEKRKRNRWWSRPFDRQEMILGSLDREEDAPSDCLSNSTFRPHLVIVRSTISSLLSFLWFSCEDQSKQPCNLSTI